MAKKSQLTNFETSLKELEKIVERMEGGEQTLEDALDSFQRGVQLTRQCQQTLKDAQQRVEKLIQENDECVAQPFDTGNA